MSLMKPSQVVAWIEELQKRLPGVSVTAEEVEQKRAWRDNTSML